MSAAREIKQSEEIEIERPALSEFDNVLRCVISHEYMRHPITTSDGFNYELSELLKWFEACGSAKSPRTQQPITTIVEATAIFQMLEEFERKELIKRYQNYDKKNALTAIKGFISPPVVAESKFNQLEFYNFYEPPRHSDVIFEVNISMPPADNFRSFKKYLRSVGVGFGGYLITATTYALMHLSEHTNDDEHISHDVAKSYAIPVGVLSGFLHYNASRLNINGFFNRARFAIQNAFQSCRQRHHNPEMKV